MFDMAEFRISVLVVDNVRQIMGLVVAAQCGYSIFPVIDKLFDRFDKVWIMLWLVDGAVNSNVGLTGIILVDGECPGQRVGAVG